MTISKKVKWPSFVGVHAGEPLPHNVTIVVLTWNAIRATATMVKSFLECPLPPNAKLLFVDNGSTDGTVPWLKENGQDVIENGENLGFTRAANKGIAACSTDVLLLNNDIIIRQPEWLRCLQETAYADGVGVVGARLIDTSGKVRFAGGSFELGDVGDFVECRYSERNSVMDVDYVCFACGYIRRSTVEKVGLLDEGFFAYCEDNDYCLRARKAGLRVVLDGRANVLHYEGLSSKVNRCDRDLLIQHSQRYFQTKWGRPASGSHTPEPPPPPTAGT